MKINPECEPTFLKHLTYVIRDHIVVNAEHYANVTLGQIREQPPEVDDVGIRVEIRFKGILDQFRKYQEGEIDVI